MEKRPDPFITWIASYPKSGNTWLRALLCAYVQQEAFRVNGMDMIPGEAPDPLYRILWSGSEPYSIYDWACMRPMALRYQYESCRYPDFMLKTHTANIGVDDMALIPRSYTQRAIYVIRDPRDVLVSCAHYFEKTYEQVWEDMRKPQHCLSAPDGGTWQFCSSYVNHIRSWTQEKAFPVLVVRYDELTKDTAHELRRMIQFLGVEPVEDRVQTAVRLTAFSELQKEEERNGFREKPPGVSGAFFRKGVSGQWRDVLPETLVREMHDYFGGTLDVGIQTQASAAA